MGDDLHAPLVSLVNDCRRDFKRHLVLVDELHDIHARPIERGNLLSRIAHRSYGPPVMFLPFFNIRLQERPGHEQSGTGDLAAFYPVFEGPRCL